MIGHNHNKIEKRLEKFIPQRKHHLRLDVTVSKPNSPCYHAKEVVDIITVVIIFIEPAIERPNPPFLLIVVRE
jgi:hypothetical protein